MPTTPSRERTTLVPGSDAARADALALRVAELSSILKAQRDQLEEQKALLEHNGSQLRPTSAATQLKASVDAGRAAG